MLDKFNELPTNAQYVIMGAGGLIGLLILILLIVVVLRIANGGGRDGRPNEKVKIPKRLPISPIKLLSAEESALLDALEAVARRHEGYKVYPKIGTQAIVGSRVDEHNKVRRAIDKSIVKDVHDYVLFDRTGYPAAIIEYESNPKDKREEQARKSGIAIVRISDARMTPDEIETRMHGIFKTGRA